MQYIKIILAGIIVGCPVGFFLIPASFSRLFGRLLGLAAIFTSLFGKTLNLDIESPIVAVLVGVALGISVGMEIRVHVKDEASGKNSITPESLQNAVNEAVKEANQNLLEKLASLQLSPQDQQEKAKSVEDLLERFQESDDSTDQKILQLIADDKQTKQLLCNKVKLINTLRIQIWTKKKLYKNFLTLLY